MNNTNNNMIYNNDDRVTTTATTIIRIRLGRIKEQFILPFRGLNQSAFLRRVDFHSSETVRDYPFDSGNGDDRFFFSVTTTMDLIRRQTSTAALTAD